MKARIAAAVFAAHATVGAGTALAHEQQDGSSFADLSRVVVIERISGGSGQGDIGKDWMPAWTSMGGSPDEAPMQPRFGWLQGRDHNDDRDTGDAWGEFRRERWHDRDWKPWHDGHRDHARSPVPEPTGAGLLLAGLAGLEVFRRRRAG